MGTEISDGAKRAYFKEVEGALADKNVTTKEADDIVAHLRADGADFATIKNFVEGGDPKTNSAKPAVQSALLRARQQSVTQAMSAAGVQNVATPPSAKNVEDYFSALGKNKASPEAVTSAWKEYSAAFLKDSFQNGGGDIEYTAARDAKAGGLTATITAPQSTADILDNPKIKADSSGVKTIDCDGYAFLAAKCFGLAGAKVRGTAVGASGSNSIGHAMTVVEFANPKTVVVVSSEKTKSLGAASPKDVVDTINSDLGQYGYETITYGKTVDEAMVRSGHPKQAPKVGLNAP